MTEEDRSYSEKRDTERKYLAFYLRVFNGTSPQVLGHVANISAQGIMLLSDKEIPLNEDYNLRMRFPTSGADKGELFFRATSRWSKKDENPDFFLTGFQIHDLKPEDQESILELLEEFSFLDD